MKTMGIRGAIHMISSTYSLNLSRFVMKSKDWMPNHQTFPPAQTVESK